MARLAGFGGKVKVVGFNPRRDETRHGMVLLGTYKPEGHTITVRILGHCGTNYSLSRYDPLATYGHELGHAILDARGKDIGGDKFFRTNRDQNSDPVERACDRYSRLLRARS